MSQHFLKVTNKLKIVHYFDGLKNKIDLLVEIYILDNQYDAARIDEINKAREEWIEEADECQAYNLVKLNENENKDELITAEQLFVRFCFLIHSYADVETTGFFTGRFVSTDVYLRPGQIECLEELLKFTSRENIFFSKELLLKSLGKIFDVVETYSQYYGRLHVTNNTINIKQHSLRMIKEPSETLFAFTSVDFGIKINAIQPDAYFLFTSLSKLTLNAAERVIENYLGDNILRTVSIFETASSLHSQLFVELKFMPKWRLDTISEQAELRVALGERIGSARARIDALDMTAVEKQPIEDLFVHKENEDGSWPRLMELNMYDCHTVTLNNPKLFENLVPNLRKVNLGRNPITFLQPDVFKHAGKLVELKFDISRNKNPIKLTNEVLQSLVNLRVLNVNLENLDLFEPFSCLCNLDELILNVNEQLPLKQMCAFPKQLAKLRVLKLDLNCEVDWIPLTAFNHLKCLERFELDYYYLDTSNRQTMQLLEIGIAPRSLKLVGFRTLRLLGGRSSVANIESMKLSQTSNCWRELRLEKLECEWPLSGLKRLSAMPLNEKSLPFNQMQNLEYLSLKMYMALAC